MSIQSDVRAATVTADGVAVSSRARVKGVVFTTTATAGSVVLKDGGASGAVKATFNTPAVAGIFNALVPDRGIVFDTNVYVDVTDVASVTVFYG